MGVLKVSDITWDVLSSGSIRGRKEISGKLFTATSKLLGRKEDEVKRILTKEIEKKYEEYKECGGVSSMWNTGRWIEEWLVSYKKPKDSEMNEEKSKRKTRGGRVSRSTYSRMLTSFHEIRECSSGKEILRSRLTSVSPTMIQRLIHDMEEAGYTSSSVRKVKDLLNAAFTQALNLGYIGRNPVNNVVCQMDESNARIVKEDFILKKKDFPIFVDEALSLNEDGSSKYTYGAAVALQLLTGCRSGEIRALSWDDINFEERKINIAHSIAEVPELDEDNIRTTGKSEKYLSLTKSVSSRRYIPYVKGDDIERCLYILKARYDNLCKKNKFAPERALVAGTSTGNYLIAANYNKDVKRIINAIFPGQGDRFSSHKLRHSFISRLINDENVDVATVAAIAGHGDLGTTLGYALHTDREKKVNTISLISKRT